MKFSNGNWLRWLAVAAIAIGEWVWVQPSERAEKEWV
jgi:hypothetical protein